LHWIKSIKDEIKNIEIKQKSIREFGIVIGVFLLLLSSYIYLNNNDLRLFIIINSPGLIIFILSFLWPSLIIPLYKIWMSIAIIIGGVVSRIILLMLYYGILTPIGIFLKIIGKDLLNQKLNPEKEKTYWVEKDLSNLDKEKYKKMF